MVKDIKSLVNGEIVSMRLSSSKIIMSVELDKSYLGEFTPGKVYVEVNNEVKR